MTYIEQCAKVRALRDQHRLSVRDMAKKVGISAATVSRLENGRTISLEHAGKVGSWLGECLCCGSKHQTDPALDLDGVERELAEESGAWITCTGCHETHEGIATGPWSYALSCNLGGRCRECGGLGAVWDNNDYNDIIEPEPAAEPSRQTQLLSIMADAIESTRNRDVNNLLIKLNGLAAKNDLAFRSALAEFTERFAKLHCTTPASEDVSDE